MSRSLSTGWLTRKQLAAAFGYTVKHLDAEILPLLHPDDVDTSGRAHLFRGRAVREVIQARERNQASEPPPGNDDDGSLARWRAAKARLVELEVARIERTVLTRLEFRAIVGPFADAIRAGIVRLQREHGQPVADIMVDAIQQAVDAACRENERIGLTGEDRFLRNQKFLDAERDSAQRDIGDEDDNVNSTTTASDED